MKDQSPGDFGSFDGFFQQRKALGDAARDGERVAQRALHAGNQGAEGHLTGQGERMFENLERFARFSLDDVERGESPHCGHQTPSVIDLPRHLHAFASTRDSFIEIASLGERPRKIGTGHGRRIAGHPEALAGQVTLQKCDILSQVGDGTGEIARTEAGQAQIVIDRDRKREIVQRFR